MITLRDIRENILDESAPPVIEKWKLLYSKEMGEADKIYREGMKLKRTEPSKAKSKFKLAKKKYEHLLKEADNIKSDDYVSALFTIAPATDYAKYATDDGVGISRGKAKEYIRMQISKCDSELSGKNALEKFSASVDAQLY